MLSTYRTDRHYPTSADAAEFPFREDETPDLRTYGVIISKYRWTIIIFLLPTVLITALSVFWTAPTYTATTTLYIESRPSNIMGVPDMFGSGGGTRDDYYMTQLDLLKSRSLAARVIQDLGLADKPSFGEPAPGPLSWVKSHVREGVGSLVRWVQEISLLKLIEERFRTADKEAEEIIKQTETFELGVHPALIDRYLGRLGIGNTGESQLVKVSFSSSDPNLSMTVVNAHITSFLRMSLLSRFELTAEARQYLEEKLVELHAALTKSEEDLTRFRRVYAFVALEHGESLIVEQLSRLNVDIAQERSRRIELESLFRTVQQRDNQLLSQIIDNPLVRQLKDQISALQMEQSRSQTTFKPTHPDVTALQEQIQQAKNRVDQEIQRVVRSIAADLSVAIAREKALTDAMAKLRGQALDHREKAIEGAILEREVESNRALYENVLKRTKEANLTGAAPVSNIRLVDRADMPLQPDDMKRKRTLLLSGLVGLLGGVGLAFLRHYLDNTLKTPEDISRFLGLPTLGMIPDLRHLSGQLYALGFTKKMSLPAGALEGQREDRQEIIATYHPLSFVRESYQTICTALRFSLPERPPRTILITSSQPREGKTVTAINIAVRLAHNGAPVLLIDADLRNGNCHRVLGVQNGSGLTNALTGNLNTGDLVKETSIPNLSLLSRGKIPPNPVELLGSEIMGQLLESVQIQFAFIIIDSAPLLPITDTVLLSTKVDGVVLVTNSPEVSRHIVRQACERLAYVRAKILGVILNNIDFQSPEYKNYGSSFAAYHAAYSPGNERE